jgi:S1-C subfamily serine protease
VAFCINCGGQNGEDADFCRSCGQRLYRDSKRSALGRTNQERRKRLLIALLTSLVAAAGIIALWVLNRRNPNPRPASAELARPKTAPIDEAVLTILGTNGSGSSEVQGSGFILTTDGLAGTNYHVLKGTTQAVAECCNGRVFEIRSIEGADLVRDLVVFQLYERGDADKPQNLPHITLGSSNDVAVGDKIIAIGSPQGLQNTVSDGIVSAIREDESIRYLQITAPISPGSSGGPVLDSDRHMVGVATSQLEGGQNLNFAVAAEYVRPLLTQHYDVSLSEFQSILSRSPRQHRNVVNSQTQDTTADSDPAPSQPLTGQFGGIVHNVSAGVSAEFGIVVTESDGVITGCMGVKQPLFGSGPLTGVSGPSDVTFVVTSAVGKITFLGQRHNIDISGTYTVEHDGSPDEMGSFTLHKNKLEGLSEGFDPANCPTDAELHK